MARSFPSPTWCPSLLAVFVALAGPAPAGAQRPARARSASSSPGRTEAAHHAATDPGPMRERLLLDFGWKFHLGDSWEGGVNSSKAGASAGPAHPAFSDASWRTLDLPHDWAVELPFDARADGAHGFHAVGAAFPETSVAWYRRSFSLPASDAGKRLWLELDGVFRNATVFVNGWTVGHQDSGYGRFRYDITDVAEPGGRNVVAILVDARAAEGWFYEGAGIYRHTWLVKTSPVAVAPDGIFVRSVFPEGDASRSPAKVRITTRLANAGREPTMAEVVSTLRRPGDGGVVGVARRAVRLLPGASDEVDAALPVSTPQRWSPEKPQLYRLETEVRAEGRTVDRVSTPFGLRTFAFDANRGFLLNGAPYVIRGTANHQDHAGVGVAVPDALLRFRLARLKQMGSNAYRSAHNPPAPEVLDACDELGLLVMDESRQFGSDAPNLALLEAMVRRDRNHASVALWSLGNEEFSVQGTAAGKRTAETMLALVKRLDPTRPVTYNSTAEKTRAGIDEAIEVRGWSYRLGADRMDAYHAAHPAQPNLGSEQGSTLATRGVYAADPLNCAVSAYDDGKTAWSNTAKEWAGFFATRPWLSGAFVWTGFDYRGEPTPYGWPCTSSQFGVLDLAGFPKDDYFLYQSWWTDAPMVHIVPHWNWRGREGQEIDVRVHANGDDVELLWDGQSLGHKAVAAFSEVAWRVPYAAGALAARSFRKGRIVAEARVETAGAPVALRLRPDRPNLTADGEDVAVVAVEVLDGQGRVVPTARVPVTFQFGGPGRLIGVGNGDPASHEPDVFVRAPVVLTRPLGGWRLGQVSNPYAPALPEVGASFDDRGFRPVDVRGPAGALEADQKVVFRAAFEASPQELAAATVELAIGRIEGDASVFLNSRKLGPGVGGRGRAIYDVKDALRAGRNVVAVAMATYAGHAGLAGGVELWRTAPSPPPAWSRSTFAGLAQVLVRTTAEAGDLILEARSPGLSPATLRLVARPTPARSGGSQRDGVVGVP